MSRRLKIKIKTESGFTLVELAVVVLLIGLLIAASVKAGLSIAGRMQQADTREKMDKIIAALAIYAQRNNRLPCPSDPSDSPLGLELRSANPTNFGVCRTRVGPITGTDQQVVYRHGGIVPFRALGMEENDVRDAWGNFFTYHVSPPFAYNYNEVRTMVSLDAINTVYSRCRVDKVWYEDPAPPHSDHLNPQKARFCCPNIANGGPDDIPGFNIETHIRIVDGNGDPVYPFLGHEGTGGPFPYYTPITNPAGYANMLTTPSVPKTVPADPPYGGGDSLTIPALVLVSHGPNGFGAFLGDGTLTQVGGPHGRDEEVNADGKTGTADEARTFIYRDPSDNETPGSHPSGGTLYFDDIVMWRSQDQLYAEFGGASCQTP